MTQRELDLLSTMDAVVWAREFCRLNAGSDEGLMVSWFANAIMAGYDHAMRKRDADAAAQAAPARQMLAALERYDRWADSAICRDPELRAIRADMRAAIDRAREHLGEKKE